MKKNSTLWRFVSMLITFTIGVWAFVGTGGPAPETVMRERAILSAAYPESNVSATPSEDGGVAEAVVVNLANVEYAPVRSMYDRWLAGEIDLDEMESRVGPAQRRALQEAALNMPLSPIPEGVRIVEDTGVEAAAPQQNTLTLLTQFDALDVSDCCGGSTSVPPDSDIAAGLNDLIAVENSSFVIYNKSGVVQAGPILFDNFLSALGASDTFDPTVLYDEEENRFVMGIEDGANFFLMVSETSNPVGSWYLYKFDARFYGNEFFDYPHIGIGDHAIFMGANMFGGSIPSGFEGRIYAMDKNAAYSGASMSWRSFSTGYDGGTPQPLHLTGFAQGSVPKPFNTHFFITDYYDGETAWLWAWPDALGSGTPYIAQTYSLFANGFPLNVPQLGGGLIQANDWRFRSFEYRNGFAWITDTVSWNPPDASGTRNWVRMTRINLSAAGYPDDIRWLFGGGTGIHNIFPDIAVNICDDAVIGYGRSGSTVYPGLRAVGITHTDDVNFLAIKDGEVNYSAYDGSPYRWGDYSGVAIDPDGKTFWLMGEYAKDINGYNANYGNYVASFNFPSCTVRSFVDVPPTGFGFSYIESVYAAGITGGCTTTPLNYCPNNSVNRAQMAIFLLRGIHGSAYTPPPATGTVFNDVPSNAFAAAWIEQLAAEGITGGCGGGNYCPNNSVTRSQMAIFLLRAKYGSSHTPPAATGTVFADIPSTAFAASWIEQLAGEGITGGCGGGNYCPNNSVIRSQMAIFLQRTFNLPLP
jgi:hypothetical protein